MQPTYFRLLVCFTWYACLVGALRSGLADFVDPLIGTEGATPGSAIAGGNSFPGASLPWGMAKVGIDTSYLGVPNGTAVDCNAGFSPLGNVTAVSMMHVSGTGGVPSYGLVSQMPLLGHLNNVNLADNTTYWENRTFEEEVASVGHFKTKLLNGIQIDLAASNHSGIFRYTLPQVSGSTNNSSMSSDSSTQGIDVSSGPASGDIHVLVDLTHVLPGYSQPPKTINSDTLRYRDTQSYSQKFRNGDLHIRSDPNGVPSYFGSATYTGAWSQPQSQTLFFCGNFSQSSNLQPTLDYVTINNGDAIPGAGTFTWSYSPLRGPDFVKRPIPRSYSDVAAYDGSGMGVGALFSWKRIGANASADHIIESRVGISYISADQACKNSAKELPSSITFEDAVAQAQNEWESKILNSIEVVDDGHDTSGNDTLKRMLYSALYQTGLLPTDKTGENPYWETGEGQPYFDDHYTLWDTYRTVMPLYHLLFTTTYTRVLSGLISIFTNEGYLPAGRIANWNGRVQGGTHADMVLADAYVKSVMAANGQQGRNEIGEIVDWHEAFKAVLNDADNLPVRNEDPVTFDGATKEGRGALDDYLTLRYITRNHTRSISRGVEYSQNDFAIYSFAKGLNASEADRFRDRADWWQNQWNPGANTTLKGVGNFTGFPGARNSDGSWNFTAYDPLTCGGCGWNDDIYEAKVWETAFSAAPHDMAKIIELIGGDEEFLKRLDASFLPGFGTSVGANNDAGSALFNPGNEPSFMTPFLYNYVPGYQWKTVNQTRAIVDDFYSTEKNGYPGNIDAGALPSWLIFNLIGLYPVAAQPIYLLGAPRFSSLKIRLFPGTAQAAWLWIKAENFSDKSWYPQKVLWNDQELDRSWVTHFELGAGGTLTFVMGEEPKQWDLGERPPSVSPWPQQ
ncbi:hypothetical protein AC579_7186 [Pseudocercospora musae]|uniref:Glycosyl hydrolase family 92 domain-containing protein n=1 Tax=Pseudocercospora musae TaxID=113226 RepID=A0A139I4G1_9PEZI|nr:hypothetical protein AC579_7186 [Pseudocercospora musae]